MRLIKTESKYYFNLSSRKNENTFVVFLKAKKEDDLEAIYREKL
jgi:hypothetical protein